MFEGTEMELEFSQLLNDRAGIKIQFDSKALKPFICISLINPQAILPNLPRDSRIVEFQSKSHFLGE